MNIPMIKPKTQASKLRLPSFEGLSEEELKSLYNLASIRKLAPNQTLIKEGDRDQTVYVVLDGEMRIVKGSEGEEERIATLQEGSWVGEIAFTRKVPRTASVIANGPSTVMAIDKNTLSALEEKTQLFIFKRLNELAFARISALESREKDLASKNKKLMKSVYAARATANRDYGNSEIIQSIIKKVPKLPVFASTLAMKLLEGKISVNEIADMIKQDPALLGMVMKTVNSSFYGFQSRISDLHHAVVLMGFNELYQLVIAEGVRRTMPKTEVFQELHAHSVAISHISFTISQESGLGKPSEYATIGLLHDLGEVVVQLFKEHNPKLVVLLESLDRSQLGALLLKTWNLPEVVWRTVAFQRYPEFSPPSEVPNEIQRQVAVLSLSHIFYQVFCGSKEEDLATTFLNEYVELVNWETTSLDDMIKRYLLPSWSKKIGTFPASFRNLILKYTGASDLITSNGY